MNNQTYGYQNTRCNKDYRNDGYLSVSALFECLGTRTKVNCLLKKRQYNFESIIPFPMVLSPSYKKRWINEELNWKKKRVISSTNKKSCTTKYNRSTHKNCRSTTLRLRELSHKKIMQLPCSYHNLVKCNKRSEPLLTYKLKLIHFPGPMLFYERQGRT